MVKELSKEQEGSICPGKATNDWYEKAEENSVFMADERKRLLLIKKHNMNPEDTFEWHKEGADLGIPLECFNVGMAYYNGDKVNADISLAKYYLEKASGQDEAHREIISETLGDIYAFQLNEPMEAVSHYYYMPDKEAFSKKLEQIRSRMGFFKRRKFDAEYCEWKNLLEQKEKHISEQQRYI